VRQTSMAIPCPLIKFSPWYQRFQTAFRPLLQHAQRMLNKIVASWTKWLRFRGGTKRWIEMTRTHPYELELPCTHCSKVASKRCENASLKGVVYAAEP